MRTPGRLWRFADLRSGSRHTARLSMANMHSTAACYATRRAGRWLIRHSVAARSTVQPVGSWANLQVGGQAVFHWKSEVDPTFLFLFTRDDVTYTPLEDPHDDPYANPTLLLRASARVLIDRLDALGISAGGLAGCLEHAIDEKIDSLDGMARAWGVREVGSTIEDLRDLTYEKWVERIRLALRTQVPAEPDYGDYTKLAPLMDLLEDIDPRWLLRALLEACEPDDEVLLDLSDLELGGYLAAYDFDPQTAATVMFSLALLHGTPAVVITEGSNDAEFLKTAIEIRRPHLANFVRFYDFGIVAGGASAALNTVKSFAAAGVNNRVIVLLDNDTAAREALRGLQKVKLPGHYAIARYPAIDLATNYPSTGPTGSHTGDVNGLAGSIELYLGEDVLTDPATDHLRPVVWGARIAALDAYQGEVAGKGAVHDAFRAKAAAAQQDPAVVAAQDWSGLDAVLDTLMEQLRTCGVADPAQRGVRFP